MIDFTEKVQQTIKKYNTKTALTYLRDTEDETISFCQIGDYIQQKEKEFQKIGLRAGDRAVILAPHSPYEVLTGIALSCSGITMVLIDASLPTEEQVKLVSLADVRVIFTTEEIYHRINGRVDSDIPFFDVDNRGILTPLRENVLDCSIRAATMEPEPDIIAVLFSSGTTDQMKGIQVTFSSVLKAREVFVRLAGLKDYMTYLLVLPFNHIAGFTGAMTYFLSGCGIGFIEDVNSSRMADGLLRFQPYYFAMVPKVYEVMEQKIRAGIHEKGKGVESIFNLLMRLSGFLRKHFGINVGRRMFKSVTRQVFGRNIYGIGTGASPCKPSTAEFYLNLGLEWSNLYAATETSVPIAATGVHDRYPSDSVGRVNAHPEIQIMIDHPDESGIGEILVKSGLMMKGYFRQPELTKRAFVGEYFRTGDYGRIDKKGYLHITGRIKESIVLRNGKKVSPGDVDEYYRSRYPDLEMASRGIEVKEDSWDEIHMFVEDALYSVEEKQRIRKKMLEISRQAPAMYKLEEIHFIWQIPKTTVGKVKRFCLEIPVEGTERKTSERLEQRWSETGAASQGKTTREGINEELLYEIIYQIIKNNDRKPYQLTDRLIQDIGMDSLNIFELCVTLQEQTGISIENYLHNDMTVGEVLSLIRGQKEKKKCGRQAGNLSQYPVIKTKRVQRNFRVLKKLFHFFWQIESYGMECLEFSGQYIFCPNHESHLDGLWIMSCLPSLVQENICSMAAEYLFEKRRYRLGVEIMGGIPVERTGNTTLAMKKIYDCIMRDGYSVLIHPEGTRTRNGELGKFKSGAAGLSKKTNVKIVPIHIEGAREIFPPDRRLPRISRIEGKKRKIVIRFGTPIDPAGKSEKYQLKYGTEYFCGQLHREVKNPKGYDICDIFDCTRKEWEKFWTKYIWWYCLKEPMTVQAAEYARRMHEEGNTIYLVTGRAHTTEKGLMGKVFRWMLRHWLKKNHFYYDEIFFCSENDSAAGKYEICMEKGIGMLIDDNAENLLALKEKIKVYCFPAVWNEDYRELDPFRIKGFGDLL